MSNFGNNRAACRRIACVVLMSAAAQAAEVPPMDSAPLTHRIWLGTEQGVVRPAAYEQVRSEAEGYVEFHAKHGDAIEKGQCWATIDPQQLEFERKDMELELLRRDQELADDLADLEKNRLRLLMELQEARAKQQDLQLAVDSGDLPMSLRTRAGEAAEKMMERIQLLEAQVTPESLKRQKHIIREESDLQLARKRKQLETLEKRSLLVASEPSTLELTDSLREKLADQKDGEPVWIKSSEVIGTLKNDTRHELWVFAKGPLLGEASHDDLMVLVQSAQTGGMVEGKFLRAEEKISGMEIQKTFVFQLAEQSGANSKGPIGVRSLVHVYRKFDEAHRLIYKKDIAFIDPDLLEKRGWAGLVTSLWPGSRIAYVGPHTIAVETEHAD